MSVQDGYEEDNVKHEKQIQKYNLIVNESNSGG